MLQLNLTRQEKQVLLVVIFAVLLGMGISFLLKTIPAAGKIYEQATFSKPSKININTADKQLLVTLLGIGPKTAKKIIDWRIKNGKFSDISQLKQIKGIGDKKLERIASFLTVD